MPVGKRLIPCLDVKDGRVVKGVRFENLRDAGDPVACATAYDAQGADELTFLDITATHEARGTLLDVVRRTAEALFIPLTVGGGVRSRGEVDALLRAGADKVAINSAAVRDPALVTEIAQSYGSQALVVAIDARRTTQGSWRVVINGGRKETELDAVAWAQKTQELGAGELLVTSMDRDGTGAGYDLELLRAITTRVTIPVIASGGVGTLEHLHEGLAPTEQGGGGADAALAATIFHDGHFTIPEARAYLRRSGVCVREPATDQW